MWLLNAYILIQQNNILCLTVISMSFSPYSTLFVCVCYVIGTVIITKTFDVCLLHEAFLSCHCKNQLPVCYLTRGDHYLAFNVCILLQARMLSAVVTCRLVAA